METQFIDAESSYSADKEPITFKLILLLHLKQISTYYSCELRGGYWEEKPHPNPQRNDSFQTYVQDSRECLSNSVEYLYDLVYPHADEELKEFGKEIENKLLKSFELYSNSKEEEYQPSTFEEAKIHQRRYPSERHKQTHRAYRVVLMKKLFREINCFLKRRDYFKGVILEDA